MQLRRTNSSGGDGLASSWWEVQNKVFALWVFTKLSTRSDCADVTVQQIQQLDKFYCDGVQLCRLVEVLSGKTTKYAVGVSNRHGMVANVTAALTVIQEEGVKLVGIGAQDIVDGKKDLIMGVLWNLMQKYQLFEKAALFKWAQDRISPFGITITNFTDSWCDGRAFNALVCSLAPSAIDMNAVATAEAEANLELAFQVAEEELHIPQLLEPEYFANPHMSEGMERIMVLYLSYFWKSETVPRVKKTLQKPREAAHIILIRKQLASLKESITDALNKLDEKEGPEFLENLLKDVAASSPEDKDQVLVRSLGIYKLQKLTEGVHAKIEVERENQRKLEQNIVELEGAKAEEIKLKEALHQKTLKLEDTINGLNGEKEGLQQQNVALMQQLGESVEKNYQQDSQIEELRGEIDKLQQEIKEKEDANRKLEEEAEDMRQKLRDRKALQDALEKAMHDSSVLVEQYKQLEQNLTETVLSNQRMANQVIALKLQIEVASQALVAPGKTAPTGDVSIVVTSIQNGTKLWEEDSVSMAKASGLYNSVLRGLLDKHEGYEVSNDNGIFTATFSSPLDAASWAMEVQLELLNAQWPEDLLKFEDCAQETDEEDNVVFKGLRVKAGLNWGQPTCTVDEVTKKTSYFGPVMDKTHAISWLPGSGGQVVCSEAFMDQISTKLDLISGDPIKTELGYLPVKGFEEMAIYQLVPNKLKNRKFQAVKADGGPAAQKLADQLQLMEEMNKALTEQIMHIEKAAKEASEKAEKLSSALRVLYTEFCDSGSKKEKLKLLMQQINDLGKHQEKLQEELMASKEASQKTSGAMKDVESKIESVALDVRQLMSKKLQELELEKRDMTEKYMAVTEELSNVKGHCYELVEEKAALLRDFKKRQAEAEAALANFSLVSQSINAMVSNFAKNTLGSVPEEEENSDN